MLRKSQNLVRTRPNNQSTLQKLIISNKQKSNNSKLLSNQIVFKYFVPMVQSCISQNNHLTDDHLKIVQRDIKNPVKHLRWIVLRK